MGIEHGVAQHYRSPGLLARIENGLIAIGKAPGAASVEDLAPVDEFHVRGPLATAELIDLLRATHGMNVLDVGSGLGGPARRLARASGCNVTGIDLSEDYCAVGTALCQWTGLAHQVSLVAGDATVRGRFAARSFDAAWTIHTAMNIADKAALYGEVARVLKPGARFVIYDILTTRLREPDYPLPWALDSSTSFLATADELLGALGEAGFRQVESLDRTLECSAFLDQASKRFAEQGPPPLGLHLVLGPVFREMIANLARCFASGRLTAAVVTCAHGA